MCKFFMRRAALEKTLNISLSIMYSMGYTEPTYKGKVVPILN